MLSGAEIVYLVPEDSNNTRSRGVFLVNLKWRRFVFPFADQDRQLLFRSNSSQLTTDFRTVAATYPQRRSLLKTYEVQLASRLNGNTSPKTNDDCMAAWTETAVANWCWR